MFSKSTAVLSVSASLVLGAFNSAQADVYEVAIEVMENGSSMGSGPGYELGDMWSFNFTLDSETQSVSTFAVNSLAHSDSYMDVDWNFEEDFSGLIDFHGIGEPELMFVMGWLSYDLFVNEGTYDISDADFNYINNESGYSFSWLGGDYQWGDPAFTYATMQVTAVPTPGALALLGLAAGMTCRRRRC